MSDRARPPRAADHGHDLRVVREPDRAQAQQARRRQRERELRDGEGDASTSTRRSTAPEELVAAVEAAGYGAVLPQRGAGAPAPRTPRTTRRRRCAAGSWSRPLLALPVLLLSMIPALQFDNWQWLALQLATPVVLWGGWPFHRAAWANLRHGTATMDTLDLARHARRLAVVAVRAVPRRRRHDRHADAASTSSPSGRRATSSTSRSPRSSPSSCSPGRYFEARAKRRAGAALAALLELGAKDVAVLGDGRRGAPRAGRAAAGRRPLRRAPGREGRHRRRRRGGHAPRSTSRC